MARSSAQHGAFIETPRGIFTSAGNWFHITREHLEAFAPGLLSKHSLKKLIRQSEVWIRSSDSLGILLFMVLLYTSSPLLAVLMTTAFVFVWHLYKSTLVSIGLTKLIQVADKEFFLVLVSVFVLSWMGITGEYISVAAGIVFFCILKFGWLRNLVDIAYSRLKKQPLHLNDRLLKMLVLRYAIKEDISVKEIQKMEQEILTLVNKQEEVLDKFKRKKK
ncbi:hypothetical protein QLX67_01755 [Balneolaceae bacterium ANBcel3]|nr:hypothetical protein [Balneolaceae bacterium ANBcel3]